MRVRPLGEFITIEPQPQKTVSNGGVIIPDSALDDIHTGTVLARGDVPLNFVVGDKVLYHANSVTYTEVNGIPVHLLHKGALLAVVSE